MGLVAVTETVLENIANAIRSKLGTSTKYTPSQMQSAINSIAVATGGISKSGNTYRNNFSRSVKVVFWYYYSNVYNFSTGAPGGGSETAVSYKEAAVTVTLTAGGSYTVTVPKPSKGTNYLVYTGIHTINFV